MNKLNRRLYAWELFAKGNLSLVQTLILMLPSSWQPSEPQEVSLFSKPFYSTLGGFLETMYQMVKCNQYRLELLPDHGVIIDGGSSTGIFSILAARKNPESTVYAFEPSRDNLILLRKNIAPYPNIIPVPFALGNKDGKTPFLEGNNNIPDENVVTVAGSDVDIVKIDTFLTSADPELDKKYPLGFLKMDIEGYELEALKGAAETIKKYHPTIVMSAYHKPEDKIELPKFLEQFGYKCELREDCEEDFVCR